MVTTTRPQTDFRDPQSDKAPQWWLELSELERGVVLTTMVVILIALVLYGLGRSLTVVADFVPNVMTEILFFAFTIVVIDQRNQQRSKQERKEELILQMGSSDNGFATEAVRLLRHYEYLMDGSLQRANLIKANLQGANLSVANLRGANLNQAKLQEAFLMEADLRGADLVGADLQGVKLIGADLQGVKLGFADLQGARLGHADLQGASLVGVDLEGVKFDEETTLPDGTQWSPDADMMRFTDPEHPEFWQDPRWANDDE